MYEYRKNIELLEIEKEIKTHIVTNYPLISEYHKVVKKRLRLLPSLVQFYKVLSIDVNDVKLFSLIIKFEKKKKETK